MGPASVHLPFRLDDPGDMPVSLVPEPRRCRRYLRIRPIVPVISCFPDLESRNLNWLILIPHGIACATRARFAEARRPAQPATRHPQSKRRVPDLAARLLRWEGLSGLIDRKPHLLRPLGAQLLSPPLRSAHPAKPAGAAQGSGGHCARRRARRGRVVRL
jgi:hypothetical protein